MLKLICNQCGKEITKQEIKNNESYMLQLPIPEDSITTVYKMDFHRPCLDIALCNMFDKLKILPDKDEYTHHDRDGNCDEYEDCEDDYDKFSF